MLKNSNLCHKKALRRILLFVLLTVILFRLLLPSIPASNKIGNLNTVRTAQTNSTQILPETNNQTITGGTSFTVNWTILFAAGNSYIIYQISPDDSSIINFGAVDSDLSEVYAQVNTNIAGSFILKLVVFNNTLNFTSEVAINVIANPSTQLPENIFIIGASIVGVIGSWGIISNWKNRKQRSMTRKVEDSFSNGLDTDQSHVDKTEDVFVSSTRITHLIILQLNPRSILHVEVFRPTPPAESVKSFLSIDNQVLKPTTSCMNAEVTLEGKHTYVTSRRITGNNIHVVLHSVGRLDPVFVNNFYSSIDAITIKPSPSLERVKDVATELIHELQLYRSFEFVLPSDEKLEYLQKTAFGVASSNPTNDLKIDDIEVIKLDLRNTSIQEIAAAADFYNDIREDLEIGEDLQ